MCKGSCCCCSRQGTKGKVEIGPAESKEEKRAKNARKVAGRFIAKVLAVKALQFVIQCGYFCFVVNLPVFREASPWWLSIPVTVYVFVFVFVRIKTIPPYFATTWIVILVTSVSFGYIVGFAFISYGMDLVSLPLAVLIVYNTYVIMLPLFMFRKMTKEMSVRKYIMIPIAIVCIQNICLVTAVALLPLKTRFYRMNKELDKFLIFCLPTTLASSLVIGFSMLQLRLVVNGQCFDIIFEKHLKDHYYAALYLI